MGSRREEWRQTARQQKIEETIVGEDGSKRIRAGQRIPRDWEERRSAGRVNESEGLGRGEPSSWRELGEGRRGEGLGC